MPAFALLCGYFSRRFEGRPDQLRKLVTSVLVPYLIFETLYSLLSAATSHKHFTLHFSSPTYVCWFLLALFVWRLTSPFWRAVPQPVLLALVVSVVAGVTVVSSAFALSRALQLLPWFVIGLRMAPEHFAWLRRPAVRIASAVLFVAAAVAAWVTAPSVDVRWFDRQWSSHDLHVTAVRFVVTELGLDLVTLLMVAAALALVPPLPSWLTVLGASTMYPYLLHGLVVRTLRYFGLHDALAQNGVVGLLTLTVGAAVLAVLLASPPVRVLTRWAVAPWELRRRPATA
jgi:fucose 4-O-acetylase-like acetyltransferase